jgi:hypothetical protein
MPRRSGLCSSAAQNPDPARVRRHANMGRVPNPPRRRITRRRFAIAGLAGAGAAAAAVYAPLAVGDGFEQLVASRLGVDDELAAALLAGVREHYGDVDYDAHAARFALSFKAPTSWLVPDSVKRAAAESLMQPMFGEPASNLAYAMTGRDPLQKSCAGLLRPS